MHRSALVVVMAVFFLSGCVVRPVRPVVVTPKGAPPGQVQKATGYNPASGKVKMK